MCSSDLMDKEDLEQTREYRKMERKMFFVGRELITYVIFLFLLMTVCYGNRTGYGFLMTEEIKNTFSGFDKVNNDNFRVVTRESVSFVCRKYQYHKKDERLNNCYWSDYPQYFTISG